MEYDALAPPILQFRDDSTIIHKRGCETPGGGYVEAFTESPAIVKFKCRACGSTWTMKDIKVYLVSKGVWLTQKE